MIDAVEQSTSRLLTNFGQRAEQNPKGNGVHVRNMVEIEFCHMETLRFGLIMNVGLLLAVVLVNDDSEKEDEKDALLILIHYM